MFVAPLSIRKNLNFLARFNPGRSEMVISRDTLYVLLWNEEYVELVSIPLLGQTEETSTVKALFAIDAAVVVSRGVLHVYTVTKTAFYHFTGGLHNFVEIGHTFVFPKISAWDDNVVVFDSNTFYLLDGQVFRNLHISPYFKSIRSYSCGYCSGHDIILYQTDSYTSIYTIGGAPILNKHRCRDSMFISDGKLLAYGDGEISLYDMSEGLELCAKINVNVRIKAEWKYMKYRQDMLYMSGTVNDGYALYVNGCLFSTEDLVQSFELYRDCFFGTSASCLYFLPKDKDFDLKLQESESRMLKNVLSGNPIPYVCRTFDSLRLDRFDGDVNEGTRVGHFLSILIYHGFRIECRKLICNILSDMRKDAEDLKLLKMLNEAEKLNYKIYRVFMNMKVDANKIYDKITEILDPRAFTEDLMTDMIEISFKDVDFLSTPRYFLLKGKKLMSRGEGFMETFYKCTGIFGDVVRVLEDNEKVVEIVLLWKNVGFCSGSSLDKICRYNLVHFVSQNGANGLSGKDAVECVCEMWNKVDDKSRRIKDIVRFIGGRYDLMMGFLPAEPLKHFLSSEIVKRSYEMSSEIKSAIDLLLPNGRLPEVSMLHYHQYMKTGNGECLKKSLRNVHDKVFVYGNRFVGRETMEVLMDKKEVVGYRDVILENTRRVKEMQDGCVWTDVLRARDYPEEYSEYLRILDERNHSNFDCTTE